LPPFVSSNAQLLFDCKALAPYIQGVGPISSALDG
jgi:hypothetical protein